MGEHRSERGQVLVLVVLALVGMLGVGALAIDLGQVYSVRRHAQNAADAAVMAAALASITPGQDMYVAAMDSLNKNGFTSDNDVNENPEKKQDVQVFSPPVSGPYTGNTEYYQVRVRVKVDKIFAQFVFSGDEVVTVDAVAHSRPSDSVSSGMALHAIGRNICPGIVFNGGSNTNIKGGNIFSNSNGTGTSGSCASGEMTGSSGSIHVTGGDLEVAGSWIQNDGATVSPAAKQNVSPIYISDLTPPSCAGLPSRNDSATTLLPGYYPGGINIQNGNYTMKAGLYCINGNFVVNGGSLKGYGVVIYMMPTAGGVQFSGSALISLSTGSKVLDANGANFGGTLIFMDKNNLNGVDMAGSNGTFYHGTIYAPGPRNPASQEKCNIGGSNTSVALRSNIICYTIGIAGNSSVTIDYRPAENYRQPPTIELAQ